MLKYPCLVLDHDDTVVNSTATIHYPAYLEAMEKMRGGSDLTLEDYFRFNFDPGFIEYMREAHHFTEADFEQEYGIWLDCVRRRVPRAYPGIDRILRRQLEAGGHFCVVSHSVDFNIRRDFRENGLPEPELVYGWERPVEERKPSPFPLYDIMEKFGLGPGDLLVVDDLKPGYDMAQAAGVDFAAALWAHRIPEIHAFMRRWSDHCFEAPEELENWLFDEETGSK